MSKQIFIKELGKVVIWLDVSNCIGELKELSEFSGNVKILVDCRK